MQSGRRRGALWWRHRALRIGAGLLAASWVGETQAAEVEPLGFLPDAISSVAVGLSADGSVVVGDSSFLTGLGEAFRWTRETGMVGIGVLNDIFQDSQANGVSPDGGTVVGSSIGACPALANFCRFGFRWSEANGMENIGSLAISENLGFASSTVAAATTGGDLLAGRVLTPENYSAFLWDSEGRFMLLPVPEGAGLARTTGVTPDGSVAIGMVQFGGSPFLVGDGVPEAVRWGEGGAEALDPPFDDGPESTALAVTPDGDVVVGQAEVSREVEGETVVTFEAVRWLNDGSREALGILPDTDPENPGPATPESFALDVSADGNLVVGNSFDTNNDSTPFLSTSSEGMRSLSAVLSEVHGIDVSRWNLGRIAGISDDGRVLAGTGVYTDDDELISVQAWRVELRVPVPEPGLGEGLVLVILLVLGGRGQAMKKEASC